MLSGGYAKKGSERIKDEVYSHVSRDPTSWPGNG